jgi:hypothetical protein
MVLAPTGNFYLKKMQAPVLVLSKSGRASRCVPLLWCCHAHVHTSHVTHTTVWRRPVRAALAAVGSMCCVCVSGCTFRASPPFPVVRWAAAWRLRGVCDCTEVLLAAVYDVPCVALSAAVVCGWYLFGWRCCAWPLGVARGWMLMLAAGVSPLQIRIPSAKLAARRS